MHVNAIVCVGRAVCRQMRRAGALGSTANEQQVHCPHITVLLAVLPAPCCTARCTVCTLCPADTPNAVTGWSPERAKAFGASHVTALLHTVPTLLKERHTKDAAGAGSVAAE